MSQKDDILIFGLGIAGTRAAYYAFQRNCLENTRIIGATCDGNLAEQLPSMRCVTLPSPPFNPLGEAAKVNQEFLAKILHEQYSGIKMLCILAGLGGSCASYYTQLALHDAKSNEIPATVIALLPHASDTEDVQKTAQATLEILHSQGHDVLPLNCRHFANCFPDQSEEQSRHQAIQWLADTAIGYLELLTKPQLPPQGTSGEPLPPTASELAEMPRGIFGKTHATFFNTHDLDIPTYMRKRINLP